MSTKHLEPTKCIQRNRLIQEMAIHVKRNYDRNLRANNSYIRVALFIDNKFLPVTHAGTNITIESEHILAAIETFEPKEYSIKTGLTISSKKNRHYQLHSKVFDKINQRRNVCRFVFVFACKNGIRILCGMEKRKEELFYFELIKITFGCIMYYKLFDKWAVLIVCLFYTLKDCNCWDEIIAIGNELIAIKNMELYERIKEHEHVLRQIGVPDGIFNVSAPEIHDSFTLTIIPRGTFWIS